VIEIETIITEIEKDMKDMTVMIEIVKEIIVIIVIRIVKKKEITEIINVMIDVDVVLNLILIQSHPQKVAIIIADQIEKTEKIKEDVQEVDWYRLGSSLIQFQINFGFVFKFWEFNLGDYNILVLDL
jgi:hypothetical protein